MILSPSRLLIYTLFFFVQVNHFSRDKLNIEKLTVGYRLGTSRVQMQVQTEESLFL